MPTGFETSASSSVHPARIQFTLNNLADKIDASWLAFALFPSLHLKTQCELDREIRMLFQYSVANPNVRIGWSHFLISQPGSYEETI